MTTSAPDTLSALVDLVVDEAARLARSGHYDGALALLAALESHRVTPQALDLMARVRAQQGRWGDAEHAWNRAVGLSPDNQELRSALEWVRRAQASKVSRALSRPMPRIGLAVVSSVFTLLLLGRGVAALVRVPEAPGARVLSTEDQAAFRLPGITQLAGSTVSSRVGEVVVIPDSGLFASGSAKLGPPAKSVIDRVGQGLAPHSDSITASLTGFTDSRPVRAGGPFADNAALGLARAVAVYERLRLSSGIAVDRFVMQSGVPTAAPFSQSEPGESHRNRTVVIRVRPLRPPQ